MDIGGNVENRQRESLRALGAIKRPDTHSEAGTCHQGEPDDGQEMAGRGGGGRGISNVGGRLPFTPGGLELDKGVV